MTTRPALAPEPVTTTSVIALVQAIERHGPAAPASVAFRAALARRSREAREIGGVCALDALQRQIAMADPERAEGRAAVLAAAWSGLAEKGR